MDGRKNAGKKIMEDQSILSLFSFCFGYEKMRRKEIDTEGETHGGE